MKIHKDKLFKSEYEPTIGFISQSEIEFDNEEQANGVKTVRMSVHILEKVVSILKAIGNENVYVSVVGGEEPVFIHTQKEMKETIMAIAPCVDD